MRGALVSKTEAEGGACDAAVGGRRVRAVVVDDSPRMLKTISMLLALEQRLDLVGTATDGHRAVRRVLELEPDLVLLEWRLPGMNGIDATRRIKAHTPAPAVILVAEQDTPECRTAAIAAGADDFVGKGRMLTQLPAAIRKVLPKLAGRARAPGKWQF